MATYIVYGITFTPVTGEQRKVNISWSFKRTAASYKFKEYKLSIYYYAAGSYVHDNTVTTTSKAYIYDAPEYATSVKVYIKPVFQEDSGNTGSQVSKTYAFSSAVPTKPTIESVEVNEAGTKALVTVSCSDNDARYYQVIAEDSSTHKVLFNSGMKSVSSPFGERQLSFKLSAGKKYNVKARVATYGKAKYSDYKYYTSGQSKVEIPAAPATPKSLSAKGVLTGSSASANVTWSSSAGATGYVVEYAKSKSYFTTLPSEVHSEEVTGTSFTPIDLESNSAYYFRVKASNEYDGDERYSSFTGPVRCVIGTNPTSPTSWYEENSVVAGDDIVAHWHHNCEDGCSQTNFNGVWTVNGVDTQITGTTASSATFQTGSLPDGTEVKFKVRTKGITNVYSEYSEVISATVWDTPSLDVELNCSEESPLTSLPLVLTCTAGSSVVGYDLFIIASDGYTYTDHMGREVSVASGETVWERHYDTTVTPFEVELGAGDISLANGCTYVASGVATMASGLTAISEESSFVVGFDFGAYDINATVSVDHDSLTAQIVPYSYTLTDGSFTTTSQSATVQKTSTQIFVLYSLTVDGEEVETTITDNGTSVTITWEETGNASGSYGIGALSECSLSVYRIEYDGSLILLESGIENTANYSVIDPHPSFSNVTYRIVAVDDETGANYYQDVLGSSFRGHGVVIQWDEIWESYNLADGEEPEGVSYAGSIVKLPYNITTEETAEQDLVGINYIGRENPVFYYGTQKGVGANITCEIPKSDKDTIASLRKLQSYMGDVYIREPSGLGYWANVSITFSQDYSSAAVPVTIQAKRADHAESAL